jgi:outer membrane protein assembly factor BamB
MRAVLISLAIATPSFADTYQAPQDFGIACLDLATGKEVWKTPGTLRRPILRVTGGLVVATEDVPATAKTLVVDAATGAIVGRPAPAGGFGALPPLPRNLDYHGKHLAYGTGGTGGLFYDDYSTQFMWFEWDASDVHVVGSLAVFAFDVPTGGEVYAYDLATSKLAWQFRAYDHVAIDEHARTDIAVDGNRVLVSTDQHVFALDAATGNATWQLDLPRQAIRRYDQPWTAFSRAGDLYLVRVYEDVFAIARDGTLRWRFEGGKLAQPAPVVAGDKVYVAWRDGGIHANSMSFTSAAGVRPSAIAVRKDGAGWRLTAESTRSAPPGTTRWSTLRPPPPSGKRVVLRLEGGHAPSYDLSGVATTDVWVEFKGIYDRAVLTVDGREVAAIAIPRSL